MDFNPADYEIVSPTKGGKNVNLKGMNPQFMSALDQMSADYYNRTGKVLNISDAFRTHAAQAEAKRKKPFLAAFPGRSLHELGLAMDLDTAQAQELARLGLLQRYGFVRPMLGGGGKYEPWHIQMAEFERRAPKVAATAKKKFNPADYELIQEGVESPPAPSPPAPAAAAAAPQVPAVDQGLPWVTRALRGVGRGLAGAAGSVGRIAEAPGIKQGLWLLDLPMKPVRAGLETVQEKLMEPHRARTEAEFAQYLKEPGAGTAAPEAFAPMPSKQAFVMPIELALMKKAYGLTGMLGKKALQAPGAAKRFITDPYALPGVKSSPAAAEVAEAAQTPVGAVPVGSNVSEAEDALNQALGLGGTPVAAPSAAAPVAPAPAATTPVSATPWAVEAPGRGIRQYPVGRGTLPGGELPKVRYGRGFGRVSADPFHIPQQQTFFGPPTPLPGPAVPRTSVPERTVLPPVPVPRTGGRFGPITSEEWAERAAGGYGFAPPAKTQAERTADAALQVQVKMGLGRPDVNKIIQQIKSIGMGEQTIAPWRRPLHDPFLEKMRKYGGG